MVNIDVLKSINQVLGITDSYKAPDRIMEILFNREERKKTFLQLLELFRYKLDYDWFHEYFQEEHAERKTNKQDFTPMSVASILSQLTGDTESTDGMTYEVAAGTGGIIISKWHEDRTKHHTLCYKPSDHICVLEELSDRTIPFLLLNLAIRGMNAAVLHGDSLERAFKQIYFIQNSENNPVGFSDLNIMPRSKDAEKYFNVQKWIGEPLTYMESNL